MNRVKMILKAKELKTFLAILIMFLMVGLINPEFLCLQNIMMCLNGGVVYIIVAIGMAFVIFTGEIDVSVGATLGFAAAVAGSMIRDGASWLTAFLIAILIGGLIGMMNGIGVAILNIPSIIMTLGVCGIVRGIVYVYTNGKWVENIPFEFKALAQASIGKTISYFLFEVLILMLIIHLILTRTKKGKYFHAVGDNIGGATLLGIPVKGTKIVSYIICGILAGIGAVIYVSRVGFITPMAGNGYEMKAIAACVIGGISLKGGTGSVIGGAIGASFMASISRILVFLGISSDYDNTITGILLITIVVMDALMQRRVSEKARRERLAARTAHVKG